MTAAGDITQHTWVRVLRDPHATPEYRYRAYVHDAAFGMVDAAAAIPDEAEERARRRWRLKWLGVESVGLVRLPGSTAPISGEIALNGHRYALWRRIGDAERVVCFVMLNPSTANADGDDATMRRCCEYAQRWGYGWLTVGNLWSYRATKPAELLRWLAGNSRAEQRRYDDTNDRQVLTMAARADLVICAWGADGKREGRGDQLVESLGRAGILPHALALTKQGHPRHPLRLAASLEPRPLAELPQRASEAAA